MYNPPHPGEIVKRAFTAANLNNTQAAQALGVDRQTISHLVNGHTGISTKMAMRLALAFNTTSKMWLNMQISYDLWQLRTEEARLKKEVTKIKA